MDIKRNGTQPSGKGPAEWFTGAVRIDFEKQRIFRDIYWKGSFATDSLLGWEERVRTESQHPEIYQHGKIFAGGSFWPGTIIMCSISNPAF